MTQKPPPPPNTEFKVQIAIKEDGLYRDCFVSRDPDVVNKMPATGFLGFTSFTGEVYDNHDILSVTTNAIVNPHEYKQYFTPLFFTM